MAYIQSAINDPTAATAAGSIGKPYGSNNTAGNCLLLIVTWDNSGGSNITTVLDTAGNTWVPLSTSPIEDTGDTQWAAAYYVLNCTAGANTVTVTFSNPSTVALGLIIAEYSNANLLEVSNGQTTGNTAAANNVTTGTVTNSINGEQIIALIANTSSTAAVAAGTSPNAFTSRTTTTHVPMLLEDFTQPTAGTIAATATITTAGDYIAFVVALGNVTSATSAWVTTSGTATTVAATGTILFNGAGASASVPIVSGVSAGSLVVAYVFAMWNESSTAPTTASVTPPAGNGTWAAGGAYIYQNAGTQQSMMAWYYKYATAAESGNYTFTFATVGAVTPSIIYAYTQLISGPTSGNPFVDTFHGNYTGSSTTATLSTFTPLSNNSLMLAGMTSGVTTGSPTPTYPGGWTIDTQNSASQKMVAAGEFTQATAAATGSLVFTSSISGDTSVLLATIRGNHDLSLDNNLVGRWDFTGSVTDSSGNGNNGTIQGTVTATADRSNVVAAAYTFNGTTGYISTTNSITNPTVYSANVWFNTTSGTGGVMVGFASNQTGTGSSNWDRLLWTDSSGHVGFSAYNDNTTSRVEVISSGTYKDGLWHMATMTMSSTVGMVLYVDGLSVGSDPNIFSDVYAGWWRIGHDNISGFTPTGSFFPGSLDDVRIYSIALTATQVTELHALHV